MALELRKKSDKVWVSIKDGGNPIIISKGHFRFNGDFFELTEPHGVDQFIGDAKRTSYTAIEVYDDVNTLSWTSFASAEEVALRLEALDAPFFNTASGGSGASVTPVSKTGTTIVFTEEAEYESVTSPRTSGTLTLDLTGEKDGVGAGVYISGYEPTITGAYYITNGSPNTAGTDLYYFYNSLSGIILNIINLQTLTAPVLTLTPDDTEILATWTASAGATAYELYRSTTNDIGTATKVYDGALLTFNSTGLTNGVDYYFWVKAKDGDPKLDSQYGTANDQPEAYPSTAFVITVQTDNTGTSSNTQFTMPTVSTSTVNCTVDWGDGNSDVITTWNDAAWTHTYSVAGNYQIIITGTSFQGIRFSNGGDSSKLTTIENWGLFNPDNAIGVFWGCDNLGNITAVDSPDLTGVTTLQQMFHGCTSLGSITNVTSWSTGSVQNMSSMFRDTILNQDLSSLDVSSCTTLSNMFYENSAFNSALPTNSTTALTNLQGILAFATSFNQDINVFNMTNVTTIQSFLDGATVFNHVSIESLDVSNVTAFSFMLRNTAVDRSFASWDVRANTGTSVGHFDGVTLSTANYDATLIGWDSRTPYNSVGWDFNNSTYTGGGAAETARTSLIGKGLSFTDGGSV